MARRPKEEWSGECERHGDLALKIANGTATEEERARIGAVRGCDGCVIAVEAVGGDLDGPDLWNRALE